MKTTPKTKTIPTAEQLARMADKGKDISHHFTNKGRMMSPTVKRVNVDFTEGMLGELDHVTQEMNVSRQAVIKFYIRQGLDQHHLAEKKRIYRVTP